MHLQPYIFFSFLYTSFTLFRYVCVKLISFSHILTGHCLDKVVVTVHFCCTVFLALEDIKRQTVSENNSNKNRVIECSSQVK